MEEEREATNSYPRTRDILIPLIIVNLLFFMWGFIWNLANVLVALFQENFELSNFQTSFLTSVSFLAFFVMSFPARIVIARLKTRRSMILGAVITGMGLLCFIPAAAFQVFNLFLVGTFIVFSGVTFLQVVCNPYIGALGPPATAASRINLSQGLGAIGAFLTSYVGGWFILKRFADDPFSGIIWFYLILGIIFFILALLVGLVKMPPNPHDEVLPEKKARQLEAGEGKKSAWSYRHFRIGFVVLLLYMGAEAILYQLMTPYFMELEPISMARAVDISGILFLGLMTGRLLGAGILTRVRPGKLVLWFALIAAALILFSMLSSGYPAIYAIVATGFFISIMFASIYSLAIEGLGPHTNEASSFLIMAISGGFFLPLLFGLAADSFSLRNSLVIVILPLLLAAWYGYFASKTSKSPTK